MGFRFLDQYSLLHFSVGVVAYFWGVPFLVWFIIHIAFEIIENSSGGILGINKYFSGIWPGGKSESDNLKNIIGDQLVASLGWIIAWYIDKLGIKYNWYLSIKN